MDKLPFVVERLKQPPFNQRIATLAEFDGRTSMELLDTLCEILIAINPDMSDIKNNPTEERINRIIHFLQLMKFSIPGDQIDQFQDILLSGDKDTLISIIHWNLQKFDHLKKRAYLSKYLLPIDVPSDFLGDPLIEELSQRLKEMQAEFKEIHKLADGRRGSGIKPSDIKNEIVQLEQEKTQLQNKINRLKKEVKGDEVYFANMLKATSALRKEQEEEARIFDKLKEQRVQLQMADVRTSETAHKLAEMRNSGVLTQSAEELLTKLQNEVRGLNERRDAQESQLAEKEMHLEKLIGWENSDRVTTEDDVRSKRAQIRDEEQRLRDLQVHLDACLERNPRLGAFHQASSAVLTKLHQKNEEVNKLDTERRVLTKQAEDKEAKLQESRGKKNSALGKIDLKKYGAQVREKIDRYKKMREELYALRAELVVLQRTEQILKGKLKNLDEFLADMERRKGVEGYRDTRRALVDMTEQTAAVDAEKGATLEQISAMVEQISREFKAKMVQVQPLMAELKALRQEFMDLESKHSEKKASFDRVTVGLAVEQSNIEKECDLAQEDCLREESRYHSLHCLVSIAKIKLDRADQEKKWQEGNGRMLRDFASFKDLYSQKLSQQEHLTKQLRRRQKELKEDSHVMSNQKTNFQNLQALLEAKQNFLSGFPVAHAEHVPYGK
jgi:intraflagellar transport protein 81